MCCCSVDLKLICFLVSHPGERYSCCANITISLAHLAARLRRRKSRTKSFRVQRLFAIPNGRKSKKEYSIIIEWFFTKFKEPDYVPVAFCTVASFTKRDFESMDSTLFFLATKCTATQLFFFFEKFPLKRWHLWIFFTFLFRLVGILKLAPFCPILVKFWREIVVLVRVLLIESSPRFTNRVQSAFY